MDFKASPQNSATCLANAELGLHKDSCERTDNCARTRTREASCREVTLWQKKKKHRGLGYLHDSSRFKSKKISSSSSGRRRAAHGTVKYETKVLEKVLPNEIRQSTHVNSSIGMYCTTTATPALRKRKGEM